MGVAVVKKPLNKKQERVLSKTLKQINRANEFGIPLESIAFKSELDASNATQSINAGITGLNDSNQDLLKSITGNTWTVPSQMGFNYWIHINLWGEIWSNKFKIMCPDNEYLESTLRRLVKHACLFGQVVFENEESYGVIAVKKVNQWTGVLTELVIQPLPMNSTDIVCAGGNVSFSPNTEWSKKVDPSKVAVLSWRDNGVGDYVYLMQSICLDLYKKMVIDNNVSNLLNLPIVKVSSLDNFIVESQFNRNPFNGVKVQIVDQQAKEMNMWTTDNNQNNNGSIAELHTDLRFHQEYYYNLFGLEVGSAKNQTLSADTNLAHSRAALIQQEKYERVEMFIDKVRELLGMSESELWVEKQEQVLESDNENAAKENYETTTDSPVEGKVEEVK